MKRKLNSNPRTSKKQLLEALKSYLLPLAYNFVPHQINLNNFSCHGIRWPEEINSFAIRKTTIGPKPYKFLQSTFRLPTIRTINNNMKSIVIETAFHSAIFLDFLSTEGEGYFWRFSKHWRRRLKLYHHWVPCQFMKCH